MKKVNKLIKQIKQSQKAINTFFINTIKNYKTMTKKIIKIWTCVTLAIICIITCSCNVTRVVSNESAYYQKGDTAVTIQTKTTETYNAKKNLY